MATIPRDISYCGKTLSLWVSLPTAQLEWIVAVTLVAGVLVISWTVIVVIITIIWRMNKVKSKRISRQFKQDHVSNAFMTDIEISCTIK